MFWTPIFQSSNLSICMTNQRYEADKLYALQNSLP